MSANIPTNAIENRLGTSFRREAAGALTGVRGDCGTLCCDGALGDGSGLAGPRGDGGTFRRRGASRGDTGKSFRGDLGMNSSRREGEPAGSPPKACCIRPYYSFVL